ncbi:phosphatase PAP2 family protein [Microbacterium sp. YJN-G]|uniref:phosphatase PAP2 family protein n=1 Tax=Microbacterium sp. YJN-G TaxID=2763257 RepID=UPI001D0C9F4B|nr:phosphatase PAP2 family protein [Microbacterium sp. YJN-G]
MTRTRMLISGGALLAAAVVLGWVVVVLFGGAVDGLDPSWDRLMVQIRQPWMLSIAYALNIIGGGWVATFLVPLLLLGMLAAMRRWRAAVYAAVTFLVSVGLTQLIKEIFGRARPEDLLVPSDFGSFPSGHTANAATIAVVLIIIFRKRWIVIAGIIWTLAMALSRTILSVHWLTDTIGGMLIGAAAALLVAAVLGRWALPSRDATVSASSEKELP